MGIRRLARGACVDEAARGVGATSALALAMQAARTATRHDVLGGAARRCIGACGLAGSASGSLLLIWLGSIVLAERGATLKAAGSTVCE